MKAALVFSGRRRHTRCALVTAVQTCALPILLPPHPDLAGRAGAGGGVRQAGIALLSCLSAGAAAAGAGRGDRVGITAQTRRAGAGEDIERRPTDGCLTQLDRPPQWRSTGCACAPRNHGSDRTSTRLNYGK